MFVSECMCAFERLRNTYTGFAKPTEFLRIYSAYEGSHSHFAFRMVKSQYAIGEAVNQYCPVK